MASGSRYTASGGTSMKYGLILIALITYSMNSFAESLDSNIESEISWGQSEEAKQDEQEQAKLLEREKLRSEQMKQKALKSAQEAKNLEAAATKKAETTRVEKEKITAQVREYQRQIKINEERKANALKKIEVAKKDVERYRKFAQEYKNKRDASAKALTTPDAAKRVPASEK